MKYNRLHDLLKEFFSILDTVEESDSGKEFHPVYISSCRVLITKRLDQLFTEIKELWFRDKAYEMKQPSIDRIDNDDNYIFNNCEFIEKDENSIKNKRKPILQYDLQGNFIREYQSVKEASLKTLNKYKYISAIANGIKQTKFIWRYKDE